MLFSKTNQAFLFLAFSPLTTEVSVFTLSHSHTLSHPLSPSLPDCTHSNTEVEAWERIQEKAADEPDGSGTGEYAFENVDDDGGQNDETTTSSEGQMEETPQQLPSSSSPTPPATPDPEEFFSVQSKDSRQEPPVKKGPAPRLVKKDGAKKGGSKRAKSGSARRGSTSSAKKGGSKRAPGAGARRPSTQNKKKSQDPAAGSTHKSATATRPGAPSTDTTASTETVKSSDPRASVRAGMEPVNKLRSLFEGK